MKILVLAGGADQIALINELKSRGHYVILADYFQNPPAKRYADKHIVASTLDLVKIEEIAVYEKVDLVCTACTDQALLTVAYVSEKLGLPCYIDYQTALNVTNKSYMKKVLMANHIPTSRFEIIDDPSTVSLNAFQFPLVVKPVDCNSSKGVKKVETIEEFYTYAAEAIKYSRTQTAIVEEFKHGLEVSADFYIENGMAKLLSATTSQKIRNRKSFTILSSDYPAVNEIQEKQLTDIACNVAKAFHLNNTPLLIQLIANDKEMSVIEFSARMGGGSKYKLIEVLTGENIMKKYVDLILGGKPTFGPRKQVNFCRMIYVYCTPGIFDHVEGFQEMKEQGYIKEFFLYKTKGMAIEKAETSGDRPAGYMVTAETQQQLDERIRITDAHLKVVSVEGNDMMIHNLFLRE